MDNSRSNRRRAARFARRNGVDKVYYDRMVSTHTKTTGWNVEHSHHRTGFACEIDGERYAIVDMCSISDQLNKNHKPTLILIKHVHVADYELVEEDG